MRRCNPEGTRWAVVEGAWVAGVGLEAVEFLRHLWNDPSARRYRERATGLLLEQLVRDRTSDYRRILRTVMWVVTDMPALNAYLIAWLRGHFRPGRGTSAGR